MNSMIQWCSAGQMTKDISNHGLISSLFLNKIIKENVSNIRLNDFCDDITFDSITDTNVIIICCY